MKQTFKLEVYRGHLIMTCNGNEVLIDTGSPETIGKGQTLEFMGKKVHCRKSLMGFSFNSVVELLGRDIDALMGMDVLGSLCMQVDCAAGEVTFSDEPLALDNATSLPLRVSAFGVTTEAEVAGRHANLIVDTGAQLSYINEPFVAGLESTGMREDFHPFMGRYEVPTYDMTVKLAGRDVKMVCGASPAQVQQLIAIIHADGVLGHDLFAQGKVVLDFITKRLLF
ncbi:MAG: hypothetical protein IKR25_06880 [Muribaculaceae bacterium]|nr:hypothetical protein [Muribaculaceae bacterium]